ncbi:MAG: ribonuclease P protein component [Bacteroidales bacterium]|nr:ribonuclease P protein component [Bacteroidales bacterium]
MNNGISYAFGKKMRLSSKKEIDSLFTGASSFTSGPYRVFYRIIKREANATSPCSLVISVPKKHIRSAVKRNLVKRRIREAFRLNYPLILAPALENKQIRLLFLCLYLPYEVYPYSKLEAKMQKLLERIAQIPEKGIDLPVGPAG